MRAHREDRPPIATACNKRRKERDGQNLRASGAFTGFLTEMKTRPARKRKKEMKLKTRREGKKKIRMRGKKEK